MSHAVITVRDLCKVYHLGGGATHNTLRDQIAHGVKAVTRLFKGGNGKSAAPEAFLALKDINFEIQQGQVAGIIGRNGAGKSTLLKVLAQITEPTAGEIHIKGRVASLLEVGTGFHPELTGRENIYLNGAILGMSKAEIKGKFDEIIAFSEVEQFLDTPVKFYSSGMSMRLAFAVAAHLEPEILLVDEVLAVGDASFQQRCLGKMDEVAKSGRTVLFVSHNMAAMSALCNVGIYIEKGRLKEMGEINAVINNYMSEVASNEDDNIFRTEGRTGEGAVRVTDMRITTDGGTGRITTSSKWRLTIDYEARREGLAIQFKVGVFDGFNTRVLALDSEVANDMPMQFPAKGRVTLELTDAVALWPGKYRLNVAACIQRDMVDYIQNALSFSVDEGDFFGTGRAPYGKATVICKTKWKLEP